MKRSLSSIHAEAAASALSAFTEAATARGLVCDEATIELATALVVAYPGLRPQLRLRPEDVVSMGKERLRIGRDLRGYRRLAAAKPRLKSPPFTESQRRRTPSRCARATPRAAKRTVGTPMMRKTARVPARERSNARCDAAATERTIAAR